MAAITRREFGLVALVGLPVLSSSVELRAQAGTNRSFINGVQFGLQPFCYHDLPMTPENRGTLIRRLVQNGFGMVELHATWVEPRFNNPGVSASDARDELRSWRLGTPVEHYRSIKKEFEAAGIVIFTYYVNINDTFTDAEVDAVFDVANCRCPGKGASVRSRAPQTS